jgi:biotin synthase
MELGAIRHNWLLSEVNELLNQPFNDLIFQAQTVHRQHFNPNEVQTSTLLNIKTGGCAEDCSYCSQSSRYDTGLDKEQMMQVEEVLNKAAQSQQAGATRFCMGAAWRNPNAKDFETVLAMIRGVKDLGMEACCTLGMLSDEQAARLKEAGLDYYNHNLDTSEAYYPQVITTRSFQDRLDTLERVRTQGMKVCSGGIIGMGESHNDRAQMLLTFANMTEHPHSVPINLLVPIAGTPLADMRGQTDSFEFIRVIATARILMPASYVRLSAGRSEMSEETQALCFLAGANSIFYGDKLLTADNPDAEQDRRLFKRLGLTQATSGC